MVYMPVTGAEIVVNASASAECIMAHYSRQEHLSMKQERASPTSASGVKNMLVG